MPAHKDSRREAAVDQVTPSYGAPGTAREQEGFLAHNGGGALTPNPASPAAFIPPFPTRGDGDIAGAIFRWAGAAGLELPAPKSTTDSYRAVLLLAQEHLGVHDPCYRRVVGSVCAEYVRDIGEFEDDEMAVVRRGTFRLVGLWPALAVLLALQQALAKATLPDAASVLAYAAAILQGRGRRPCR